MANIKLVGSFNSNLASFVCRNIACSGGAFGVAVYPCGEHGDSLALSSSHKLAAVAARRGKVGVLLSLGTLFASTHLTLVKRVACGDGIFFRRHGHAYLALLQEGTSHRLLGLLAGRWCVDHLLRLKQELVDSVLALDGRATAHSMHIIGVHGHLLWIDELVDHGLAVCGLGVRDEAAMVRALRVVAHRHLLSRGSIGQLWLDLAAARFALRPSAHSYLVATCHASDLTSWVFTWGCPL